MLFHTLQVSVAADGVDWEQHRDDTDQHCDREMYL